MPTQKTAFITQGTSKKWISFVNLKKQLTC